MQEIIKRLKKEKKELEMQVKYRKLYNIKNMVIKGLIKSSLAIEYSAPFILAAFILSKTNFKENRPFYIDKIPKKMNVESINTSNGLHLENVSFDNKFKSAGIEYSTGWILNGDGFYERTLTSYVLNKKVDLTDVDEILSMTKDEIEQLLSVSNIRKICKTTLTDEDMIYDEDIVIITQNYSDDKHETLIPETEMENVLHSLLYFFEIYGLGWILKKVKKVIFKNRISNKLSVYQSKLKLIGENELESLKRVLEIRQENLKMLNEDSISHEYKLRKDKKVVIR